MNCFKLPDFDFDAKMLLHDLRRCCPPVILDVVTDHFLHGDGGWVIWWEQG